jgi:hypothetical protein
MPLLYNISRIPIIIQVLILIIGIMISGYISSGYSRTMDITCSILISVCATTLYCSIYNIINIYHFIFPYQQNEIIRIHYKSISKNKKNTYNTIKSTKKMNMNFNVFLLLKLDILLPGFILFQSFSNFFNIS